MHEPEPHKTNAVRILEKAGVPFELRAYEVDLEDLSAPTVAAKVGLPAEQVWKTLLLRGDRHGLCFALVAGDAELDLKALELHDVVSVSAGVRGTQVLLAPADYLRVTGAKMGPIARS